MRSRPLSLYNLSDGKKTRFFPIYRIFPKINVRFAYNLGQIAGSILLHNLTLKYINLVVRLLHMLPKGKKSDADLDQVRGRVLDFTLNFFIFSVQTSSYTRSKARFWRDNVEKHSKIVDLSGIAV